MSEQQHVGPPAVPPYTGTPPAPGAPQGLAHYGPPSVPYPPPYPSALPQQAPLPPLPPPPPPVGQYYATAYPAVPAPLKDVGVAYLLWFFLGGFGGHHFYLRRPGLGGSMLAVALLGWLTSVVGVGVVLLAGVFVWWVVDACLMPERIRRLNHVVAMTNGVAQQQHGYPR